VLRISEQWHASDLGRQRQGNEDNYFVRAPLFVVADGMGGAQAGEVASQMAVDAFERGLPDGEPADGLQRVIEGANRRIHDHSQAEAARAGMGTTVTAAYVGEGDVTIAHVGDSRAYLLRGQELTRLTRDHSLVDELMRRGKLTQEQADVHPQRSVITRALGPEPDVEVDIETYQARGDDVFLLCSDGLTGMVPEARVKAMLEGAQTLETAGRELITAANEAGGRDNITVILFRLEELGAAAAPAGDGETTEYETWEGDAAPEPRQGVSRPQARASDEMEAEYRRSGTVALPTVRPPAEPIPEDRPARREPIPERPPARRRRRRRRALTATVVIGIALAMVLAGLWTASRAVYFVGADERSGVVTIYRGLPYELPFGIDLYERYYPSGVTLTAVPTQRRATFTDHRLRSKDDAESLVRQLERGELD
jgi:PPM family protein phosphatase